MQSRAVSENTFAKALGYSLLDVKNLMDGRLLTTDKDIADISEFFNVPVDYILTDQGKIAYSGPGFLHCVGSFSDGKNEDKVLDIFDQYCDLKNMLQTR